MWQKGEEMRKAKDRTVEQGTLTDREQPLASRKKKGTFK
jgi:hypothetical protein